MNLKKLAVVVTVCALCAALLLPGGGSTVSAQKKEEAQNAVRVHLMDVEVKTTNKDGQAWDINDGKPDIFVRIKNTTDTTIKEYTSKVIDDAYKATFNEATVLVAAGQTLRVEVYDKDLAADDLIGQRDLKVTDEMIKSGKHQMKDDFGQVVWLNLEFRGQ